METRSISQSLDGIELMDSEIFPAKILLFGEYGILLNGAALARPWFHFSGKWSDDSQLRSLSPLREHLENISFHAEFDIGSAKEELDSKMRFNSTIPHGVGLGSSAALSAAIYSRYTNSPPTSQQRRQEDLACIEGFFHGKSSGFDALVCYEKQNLISRQDHIQSIEVSDSAKPFIYLLDSGHPRLTKPLVARFFSQMKSSFFADKMESMLKLNEEIIACYTSGKDYWSHLIKLSQIQFDHMGEYIIPELHNHWAESFTERNISLKLCGAGGGGYYLLFSQNALENWKGFDLLAVTFS